ncbi:YjeE family ATPase [Aphanomyces astaci]|uniref:tRNA threonylcarbamoyladenosine biosynthesis protein TsaE n=1 Tax=Aphanomyces astaci TaxID=112090 RepID=W4GAE6_APHAT|nr:YjeE family ATPase [Aphanomyces astaci]ETV75928.1 YjeE family ATPase [Aphanomyces astaci]|eukprot:XP_009834570.1 YjeE family ATPase [Aphanomyces astaci]
MRGVLRRAAFGLGPIRQLSTSRRVIHGEGEMERLGAALAAQIPSTQSGNVLLLHGDLGSGKTCLARGLARTWCCDPSMDVTSPTYLLINTYDPPEASTRHTLHHMDLYRLDSVTSTDVEALGLEDTFTTGTSIVEWPDRLQVLPTPRLDPMVRNGSLWKPGFGRFHP